MTTVRRLVLVRHARAEPFAASDLARELTRRGREDATRAGAYLREQGVVPDHALVSDTARTRATWEAMETAMGSGAAVVHDSAVYWGSDDVVLDALRAVPPSARVLAFVGHQPTVGYLAHSLDDGAGNQEALRTMLRGFPACSLALFDVEVEWPLLGPGAGRLVDFRGG